MTYLPHTGSDRAQMLEAIGVAAVEDLFRDVPESCRFPELRLPPPLS